MIQRHTEHPSGNHTLPISSLPVELLRDIFDIAHPVGTTQEMCSRTEIALSQVSRNWHFVALACPFLWNRIDINRANSSTLLANLYFRRCPAHPLYIRFYDRSIEDFCLYVMPYINHLAQSHRIVSRCNFLARVSFQDYGCFCAHFRILKNPSRSIHPS